MTTTPETCPFGCGANLIPRDDEEYEPMLAPEYRCGSHQNTQMPLCKVACLTKALAVAQAANVECNRRLTEAIMHRDKATETHYRLTKELADANGKLATAEAGWQSVYKTCLEKDKAIGFLCHSLRMSTKETRDAKWKEPMLKMVEEISELIPESPR